MSGHDLICIGGSAGSVQATLRLAEELPGDIPAAVLLVIHVPRDASSNLPKLLEARSRIRARFAQNGEAPQRGVFHVAPADRHLVVTDGAAPLARPPENGYRPSAGVPSAETMPGKVEVGYSPSRTCAGIRASSASRAGSGTPRPRSASRGRSATRSPRTRSEPG